MDLYDEKEIRCSHYCASVFFQYVATQFGKVIKQFRLDNAPELSFTKYFLSKGVLYQYYCVERPEQNSVVE